MNKTHSFRHLTCIALLALFTALVAATTASAAGKNGLPPAFGKVCGHVNGASWKFQGQTGIQYNVVGLGGSCAFAMKVVSALTKQKPQSGILGPRTLIAKSGYRCAGSGIPLAHAGFCAHGAAHFIWAPQLKA